MHEVAGEDQDHSTIDHRILLIEQRDKGAIIEQLASGAGKTLIFARTRAFAEQLADQLEDAGVPATSLHGDLNQSRRTRNLSLLTSGRVNVLVATDVAARGIHVDDISLVIQADPPDEYKSYLHRAGRTGRAGKPGTVVTLVNKSRRRRMDELLGRAEIKASMVQVAPGDAVAGRARRPVASSHGSSVRNEGLLGFPRAGEEDFFSLARFLLLSRVLGRSRQDKRWRRASSDRGQGIRHPPKISA